VSAPVRGSATTRPRVPLPSASLPRAPAALANRPHNQRPQTRHRNDPPTVRPPRRRARVPPWAGPQPRRLHAAAAHGLRRLHGPHRPTHRRSLTPRARSRLSPPLCAWLPAGRGDPQRGHTQAADASRTPPGSAAAGAGDGALDRVYARRATDGSRLPSPRRVPCHRARLRVPRGDTPQARRKGRMAGPRFHHRPTAARACRAQAWDAPHGGHRPRHTTYHGAACDHQPPRETAVPVSGGSGTRRPPTTRRLT
jgi:hypothetical protein